MGYLEESARWWKNLSRQEKSDNVLADAAGMENSSLSEMEGAIESLQTARRMREHAEKIMKGETEEPFGF